MRARAIRLLLLLALLGAGVGALLWTRCGIAGCPDVRELVSYRAGGAPVLLDRNGEEFASLHPLERDVVPLEALPDHVADAVVAVEDRRFFEHPGVDPIRVAGAALHNLLNRDERQGASTITMQLARSVFPDRLPQAERTFQRKLLETRVALAIELEYSKPAILELYLNHVYFGGGTHGIEAASRYYFDKSATDLTVAEAALLAGMVQAPARTDPRRAPERAMRRRNLVLSLMEDQGLLTAEAAGNLRRSPLGVSPQPAASRSSGVAPYFVETVQVQVEELLGAEAYRSGLRVHTTLDPRAQAAAERVITERLREIEAGRFGTYGGPAFDPSVPGGPEGTDYLQGAVVVMDPTSGDVLALVGGRDFAHSRFNRATRGRRPVGSAFKPFVVMAALREGFVPSQPIRDRPFRLEQAGAAPWVPQNYDREHRGSVDMRESLVHSLNVPIARLALATGVEPILEAARDVGMAGSIPATPALALGTVPLSPLELTEAYATLASQGHRRTPRFIRRVEDRSGRVLFPAEDLQRSEEAPDEDEAPDVDPRLTFLLTGMLEEVVERGTGTGVRSGGFTADAAGKTGTTQEGADAWFVGYTPAHVATVWIGHDRPRSILPGASGGALAAPVWGSLMASLQNGGEPPRRWSRPSGIVERSIDPQTGLTLAAGCRLDGRSPVPELFLEETIPEATCPEQSGFFSRIANTVRGWFGGDDGEEESPSDETSVQVLDAADSDGALLGVERLTLEGG